MFFYERKQFLYDYYILRTPKIQQWQDKNHQLNKIFRFLHTFPPRQKAPPKPQDAVGRGSMKVNVSYVVVVAHMLPSHLSSFVNSVRCSIL